MGIGQLGAGWVGANAQEYGVGKKITEKQPKCPFWAVPEAWMPLGRLYSASQSSEHH
ncbi:hypothetical protein KAM338_46200 [Aeromonas caviae]|nr:hypothetical protein KAM339_044940 [Aeromonas caviae]BDN94631.1 hypothetical protein KAM497c_41750 [Aeromonas caviae]GJA21215.1 hypothetical protein KAM336_42360 [Aeromonas caviae]GJA25603.1 hypothetical protein KAM337_41310 [Aeromonas caviae]GJB04826.1 hypothetical protein KAM360_37690 [Aeromonas caviae]